ncbi:MAG TPA: 6,7-dimethyl-8-ribityllumazine synthase [Caulobacteraceae bacterium]
MTSTYRLSADGASPTGRIAFVQSSWHKPLVDQTLEGFRAELTRLGYSDNLVDRWELPGAFEIPLHAKQLAKTGRYAAVVAAALVIDGGIYRHEFVAETVVRALMQVQLETNIPVFSVVLTPHHFHEHETHESFFRDHLIQKGEEAARACAQTMESLARIPATV